MSKKNHKANINSWFWMSSSGLKATSDSLVSPFLPLYGIKLGANPSIIGLIVSISSLLSIIQIFWVKVADRIRNTRIVAILSNYSSGIFNFLFAAVQRLSGFITFRVSQSLVASASIPTSSALLAERTQTKDWPYWNGLIQAFIVLGTLIGVLLGGFLLSRYSEDIGFTIIFLAAGVISILASILFQIAVPKKKRLEKRRRWYQVEEVSVSIDNALAVMKTDKNFIMLALASFIFIFGVNFSAPFYIVYNINDYGLTIFQTSQLTAIGLVPQIISSFLTVKLIEKTRSKEVLIMGGLITAIFPLAFILPSVLEIGQNIFIILIVMWLLNGIAWGVINTSLATLVLDVIHPRRRTLQLAISNSLNSVAMFIAPILGGLAIPKSIIDGNMSVGSNFIYLIFIISAVFRFVGALIFIKVEEPIIGGTVLRPINKMMRVPIRTNIEKIVSTISTAPHRIRKRRKSTKTYGKISKEKTT